MMNYNYSGCDGYCLEEFLDEFEAVAEINEWRKSDYSLILGAFLEGAAYHYYRMIFEDDMDFTVLCNDLRSEFHRRCRYCEQHIIIAEIKADKKGSNVLCDDVKANLFSSIVIKDEQAQNNIQCSVKSLDHIDEEGDEIDDDGGRTDGESCLFEDGVSQTSRDDGPVDVELEVQSVFQGERVDSADDSPADVEMELDSLSNSDDEGIVMYRSSPIDSANSIYIAENDVEISSEQHVVVPSEPQNDLDFNILMNPIDFKYNIENKIEIIQSDLTRNFTKVILKRKTLTAFKKSFLKNKPKKIHTKYKKVFNKVTYGANINSKKAIDKKVIRIKYKRNYSKTSWGIRFGLKKVTEIMAKKNSLNICYGFNVTLGCLRYDVIKEFDMVKCKFWKFYRKKLREKML